MSFEILTDTSANLPDAKIREYHLKLIPFLFYVNGEEKSCLETEGFDGEAFYQSMRERVEVSTSQITPQRFVDEMEPLLQAGRDVLYVGMSSGISGAFQSAEMAARQLREQYPQRKIRLVDTLAASLGEGLQVLWAAKLREQGATLDETADTLLRRRVNMCQIFTVDDLAYLRRGGRISRTVALVGSVLQIKPLLKGNEEGRIVMCGKVRGRKASLRALAERYGALVTEPEKQVVGIAHAACAGEAAYLASLLREKGAPAEILTVCYEPVTGSHVGPGTVALFFTGGDDVRSK